MSAGTGEDVELIASRLADEAVAEISELSLIMAGLLTEVSRDQLLALRGMAVRCNELALMAHSARDSTGPELQEMRDLLYGRLQDPRMCQKGGMA